MKIDNINKEKNIIKLKKLASELRIDIINMIHNANSGHPGGSLSAVDILVTLYFKFLNVDPNNPGWEDRDRFIMSKGHACPVWYATLSKKGYFDKSHLSTLRKINSILQGHPDMKKTPGIDMTIGSLGNGLGIGVGMALAAKLKSKSYLTYVLLGCSEHNEGVLWEAALAASKFKLDNLIAIVDYNKLQLDGYNYEVLPIEPLEAKWKSFGWSTIRINGHDIGEIIDAVEKAKSVKNVPNVIIADTIKGKGISFMEDKYEWHGKTLSNYEYNLAIKELTGK